MPMKVLASGKRKALNYLHRQTDLGGCYVLLDRSKPFYVGISRQVISRLAQHVKGKTHFSASLAYRMACNDHKHSMCRAKAMADPSFLRWFHIAQGKLLSMDVATVEITNDLELYLFEAYACLELGTADYNSFRTH